MGHFPSGTPATVGAAVLSGRRTIQELVDRYGIRHQGVRQLLLDYLARREPEMDYSTLDQLSRSLAGLFWAKIEALAPGQSAASTLAGDEMITVTGRTYQRVWTAVSGTLTVPNAFSLLSGPRGEVVTVSSRHMSLVRLGA